MNVNRMAGYIPIKDKQWNMHKIEENIFDNSLFLNL